MISIVIVSVMSSTIIDISPQEKVLVTSSQTGFDIDYLVELTARIQISNVTFEGYS